MASASELSRAAAVRAEPRPSPSDLPAAFTHADAQRASWSTRGLHAAFGRGYFQRIARGVYAQPDLDADPGFVEIAVRAPGATLCLPSALFHHGLVAQPPSVIHVALPSGQRIPRTQARVTWRQVDEDVFALGRSELDIAKGVTIGVYSAIRTIIDVYGLAHYYGTQNVDGLLEHWLSTPDCDPDALVAMTHRFEPTGEAVRTALVALQSPDKAPQARPEPPQTP